MKKEGWELEGSRIARIGADENIQRRTKNTEHAIEIEIRIAIEIGIGIADNTNSREKRGMFTIYLSDYARRQAEFAEAQRKKLKEGSEEENSHPPTRKAPARQAKNTRIHKKEEHEEWGMEGTEKTKNKEQGTKTSGRARCL